MWLSVKMVTLGIFWTTSKKTFYMRHKVFDEFLMAGRTVELVQPSGCWVRGMCAECIFFDYSNHFSPYALRSTEQCLASEAVRNKCITESRKQRITLVWKERA